MDDPRAKAVVRAFYDDRCYHARRTAQAQEGGRR